MGRSSVGDDHLKLPDQRIKMPDGRILIVKAEMENAMNADHPAKAAEVMLAVQVDTIETAMEILS